MANRIKPLRRVGSTGQPNIVNMQEGEIAVNSYDQKIWMRVGNNLVEIANAGGSSTWGSITGTLSNQTDLKNALDDKANSSVTLTAGTGLLGGGNLTANRAFTIDPAVVGRIDLAGYAPTGDYDTFPIGARGYTREGAENPNSPGTGLFLETVGGYGANDDRQFAWPHRTIGQFRFRCKNGGTYGPWKEIWTSDTFNPASKVDMNGPFVFSSTGTYAFMFGDIAGTEGLTLARSGTQAFLTSTSLTRLTGGGVNVDVTSSGLTVAGNLNVTGTELRVGGSRAVEGFNDWLRLNEGNHFTNGTLARGTFRAYSELQLYEAGSEFLRANNNNTTLVRQPRMFVQSGDPGSNAATGDLWIW